nr:galectin-12 isoform X2 [Aotus nancymaae]
MSPGEELDPIPDSFILQPPVFHPVVPYVMTIFGGLHAGKMVMLQGVVPPDAHRFQVDFQCGCSLCPRPDIAFHFNPRFHTTRPHVICNTLHGGRWQREARWPHLALQRGSGFLILFLFGSEEVSVNGQHFLRYRYRLPLSHVDTLGIFGDILVEAVGFLNINPFVEGSREYPAGHPFLLMSPRLPHQEPKPGDLIEIFPIGYEHWALYVGNGYVIHLAPPSEYPGAGSSSTLSVLGSSAMVKQECLEDVVGGCHYWVSNSLDHEYRPRPIQVIINSAKGMVGQKMKYSIVSRNCEHFVTKLRYGKSRCKQVERAKSDKDVAVILGILGIAVCSFLIGSYRNQ